MLRLEVRKYPFDIQQACDLLLQFTQGKSFADYSADPVHQHIHSEKEGKRPFASTVILSPGSFRTKDLHLSLLPKIHADSSSAAADSE